MDPQNFTSQLKNRLQQLPFYIFHHLHCVRLPVALSAALPQTVLKTNKRVDIGFLAEGITHFALFGPENNTLQYTLNKCIFLASVSFCLLWSHFLSYPRSFQASPPHYCYPCQVVNAFCQQLNITFKKRCYQFSPFPNVWPNLVQLNSSAFLIAQKKLQLKIYL